MAEPPPILWHYTTWEGFDGIRRSGKLWLSKIGYMNDRKELAQAVQLMTAQLPRVIGTTGDRPCFIRDVGYARMAFERVTHQPGNCISSFSVHGDDLSQWRAYGGGGPSFALGFRSDVLAANGAPLRASLQQCIYDVAQQLEALTPSLEKIRDAWPSRDIPELSHERRPAVEAAVDAGWNDFVNVAARIKHPAFANEGEWRLVTPSIGVRDSAEWEVHRSGNMVVPHLSIDLSSEGRRLGALGTIVIGPHAHIELTQYALAHLRRPDSLGAAEVRTTNVPFRNW